MSEPFTDYHLVHIRDQTRHLVSLNFVSVSLRSVDLHLYLPVSDVSHMVHLSLIVFEVHGSTQETGVMTVP